MPQFEKRKEGTTRKFYITRQYTDMSGHDQREEQAFITEVSLRDPSQKDDGIIRDAQPVAIDSSAPDVSRFIDKNEEKLQHSRSIRSVLQRAANKTILVVRTKAATQAAENVTVRFHKNQVTETPRAVQLRQVSAKVLKHLQMASSRKRRLFDEIFMTAPELDILLKDMFWYLTAHCFQPERNVPQEEGFYQRIADNFTSLFIRIQVQPSSRDSGFLDMLPDVLAQILFMGLYEAFPKSRKNMAGPDMRKQILHICYSWILGFVPANLKWSHWIAVDQDSPKRVAALAEFPAMRNRMLRAERIERTKIEVKNNQSPRFDGFNDADRQTSNQDEPSVCEQNESERLPPVTNGSSRGGLSSLNPHQGPARERRVYQMQNSPLVGAFLKRHQLEGNANRLKVQLRLTGGKHFDLQNQEALQATTLPRERRRRPMTSKMHVKALDQIECDSTSMRLAYASEKTKSHTRDFTERRQLAMDQVDLEVQYNELRQEPSRMREYSNALVSGRYRDAAKATKDAQRDSRSSNLPGSSPSLKFVPRPPPPRTSTGPRKPE